LGAQIVGVAPYGGVAIMLGPWLVFAASLWLSLKRAG
jgi:hypothetical protein